MHRLTRKSSKSFVLSVSSILFSMVVVVLVKDHMTLTATFNPEKDLPTWHIDRSSSAMVCSFLAGHTYGLGNRSERGGGEVRVQLSK